MVDLHKRLSWFLVLVVNSYLFAAFAFGANDDQNPYAPPKSGEGSHKRDSCATLGYGVELNKFDQRLLDSIKGIRELSKNPNKSYVEVRPDQFTKKNGKNTTHLTVIHVPEPTGVDILESRKLVQDALNDLEAKFVDLNRRPVGDLTKASAVICGIVACFRIATYVVPLQLARWGMVSFASPKLFPLPDWFPSAAVVTGVGVVMGLATAGLEMAEHTFSSEGREFADSEMLQKAREDVKRLSESNGMADQDSHFILITRAKPPPTR